jgi:hypothetical protein
MKTFILLLAGSFFISFHAIADTTCIKVHFLYGSRPKKDCRETEDRWFGGIHGGHVGIEVDSNRVMDFLPGGKFHYIEHHNDRHSHFAKHSVADFWKSFASDSDKVTRCSFIIPIDSTQKALLDSIYTAYTSETPYDYAFIGMRCAAAASDVLAKLGILREKGRRATYMQYFYPKILRKKLFHLAKRRKWQMIRHEGVETRIWEND